jgi:hypothetical protein
MRRHGIGQGTTALPVQPRHDTPAAPRPPPRPLFTPALHTIAFTQTSSASDGTLRRFPSSPGSPSSPRKHCTRRVATKLAGSVRAIASVAAQCSITAAAVRLVAAARAAAALRAAAHAVPSSRARSCRRARRDMTVVHVPSPPASGFPPSPTATPRRMHTGGSCCRSGGCNHAISCVGRFMA